MSMPNDRRPSKNDDVGKYLIMVNPMQWRFFLMSLLILYPISASTFSALTSSLMGALFELDRGMTCNAETAHL